MILVKRFEMPEGLTRPGKNLKLSQDAVSLLRMPQNPSKIWIVLLALIIALLGAECVMAIENIPLSAGPDGVEAIAVSPNAIDIYLPSNHTGVSIYRNGQSIANVLPGERKARDYGLEPDTIYIYTIIGLGDTSIIVSEKTFPSFQPCAAYDVVIVDASAAGTAAAVAAARLGVSVALIEKTNRAGGMASNGLGSTDIRQVSRSNGFFEEFRARIRKHYGNENGLRYEPRIANAVMKSMIYAEPGISFFRKTCATAAIRQGPRIAGVAVTNLDTGEAGEFYGQVVIDATVEADIAAASGVRFRIPREARTLQEPHAGFIYFDNETSEILPGSTGQSDCRVQSYAYLLTVKDYGEGQDQSIPMPPNYNPEDYRYSPVWEKSWAVLSGRLPNGKFELNQHPWGTDLPGINYDYPYADVRRREQIAQQYLWRALGYLYYLQNELGLRHLGLAEDEYPDNYNLPLTLYVRGARRMFGRAVMYESDVTCARERYIPTSIAIGDYPMDSHATEVLCDPDAKHRGEGEWWLVKYTPWYRVPLGIIMPEDAPGLLVPMAVSATHVAYGTLRMEPVRMSLGQAAGTLAALSIRYSCYPDQFPIAILQDRLLTQKAYLTWFKDVNKRTRHFRAIQFLAVRGFFMGDSFRPDENLTVEEAMWLINRLVKVEMDGPDIPIGSHPGEGGRSITRAEFAQLLVAAKQQIDPEWTPQPTVVSHYADLQPGTFISSLAEKLYSHRIDTKTWVGPPSRSDAGLLFHPEALITRADAAQALWLADRPVALKFDLTQTS
jgi:hypothetical protein